MNCSVEVGVANELVCDASDSVTNAPSRVLHVIPQLGGGGSERFVITLLPLLDRSACEPSLCVLGSINAFPSRTEQVGGAEFLGYDGSLRNLKGMHRCVRSLQKMVVDNRIDIVHSHLWPAARLVAMALRGLSVKHVVHVQDTRPWLAGTGWRDRFFRMWTNRVVPRSLPTYIAVSQAAKDYTCRHLSVDEACVRVIPNAVDLAAFGAKGDGLCEDNARTVVGMVALMKPEKGHQDIIRAIAQLVGEGHDVELRLAGDGSLRRSLEALVESLGLSDRVVFAGLIDDVQAFLHQLDIFVLPSVFGEGLPLTIVEAMACRLPVIAGDVAGACEIINDGQNGLLVPPRNPDAIADAIRMLANDPGKRESLAQAGLETVTARFSFESVARRVEAVYRELSQQP